MGNAISVLERIKTAKVSPGKGEKCPDGLYQIELREFHLHNGFHGEVVVIGFKLLDGAHAGATFAHTAAVGKRPDTAWRDVIACVRAVHGMDMYASEDTAAHAEWAGKVAAYLEAKGAGLIGKRLTLRTKLETGTAPDGSRAWVRHTFTPESASAPTTTKVSPVASAPQAPPIAAPVAPPLPPAPPPVPAVVHPTFAGWHVSARRGFPWYEADSTPGALWNSQTNVQERE